MLALEIQPALRIVSDMTILPNGNHLQEEMMKISARNILKGRIKSVEHGAVNSEVVIELAGGSEVVSIITKDSAEGLAGIDRFL